MPLVSGSGVIRDGRGGDFSIEGIGSLSNAFVIAENLITGTGISSSELSLSEYVRAWVSVGTDDWRFTCGRAIGCLYICFVEGLLESDAKWDEPIGVGDAVVMSRDVASG